MILRKPFAILIKNFKRIHIVLAVLACYMVYETSVLSSFFTSYIKMPTTLLDPTETDKLIPFLAFLIPVILILGCLIILVLMRFKKKPITFYIVSILVCMISVLAYVYSLSTLSGLEINLTDVRTLKLNQDITRTALILQFFMALIMIVRATGFDIKKFDFNKDLEQLDIEEADNEEFEFNVEFEEGKYKRNLNRFRRYAKYIIKENKVALTILGVLLLTGIGVFVYLNITVFHKVYKIGDSISTNDFGFTFEKVYQTPYDYEQKQVENKTYIIVNFEVQSYSSIKRKLESARVYLEIKGHKFYHNKDLNDKFFDLGTGYADQKLNTEKQKYSFIYEIPNTLLKYDKYLYYTDGLENYKIKVSPTEIGEAKIEKEYRIGDTANLANSILGKSSITFTSLEIAERFKETYEYCISSSTCLQANEYVIPTFAGNETKVLMKLVGSVSLSKDSNIDVDSLSKMSKRYGTLQYQVGNNNKTITDFVFVKPKQATSGNTIYIEVSNEILNASSIWFDLTIRDKTYRYILK
ncbi:MAG: hypothetical protein PHN72_00450 [Bacilli bacterium]|nr:hypothetical protein [Bacilli bacterium]